MFEKSRNIWLLGVSALDADTLHMVETPNGKNVVLSAIVFKTNSKYYEILTL